MAVRPRRRRTILTLGQLKGRLSAGIEYATKLLEDEAADHELRLKGFTALIQASATYAKIMELYDIERQVKAIEQLAPRNGHHPA
jgi:hypothetical protein